MQARALHSEHVEPQVLCNGPVKGSPAVLDQHQSTCADQAVAVGLRRQKERRKKDKSTQNLFVMDIETSIHFFLQDGLKIHFQNTLAGEGSPNLSSLGRSGGGCLIGRSC